MTFDRLNLSYESLSVDDYSKSTLPTWLEYDWWTPEEAVCLVCGVDPTMADIDWYGTIKAPGMQLEGPFIRNALLLDKDRMFYFLPRPTSPNDAGFEFLAPCPLPEGEDEDYWQSVRAKNRELDEIEEQLIRVWQLLKRSVDAEEAANTGATPMWYVEWARKKNIGIPWLEWAERNGVLAKSKSTADAASVGIKPLAAREKNTLLVVIASLLKAQGIEAERRGTANKLVRMTEELGTPISDDTARKILKSLSYAVEARQIY